MPRAVIDGIDTEYEVTGSGPPLLMFSPGGFDARRQNWQALDVYQRTRLLAHLERRFICITFDRRESGGSGGKVQRVTWGDYAAQGRGLLRHLQIGRAHLMGGCVGCSAVLAFAVAHPDEVRSMVLYSPAGGARYRLTQQSRFTQHLAYLDDHDLGEVVALARSCPRTFAQEPRIGPWGPTIRADQAMAASFAEQDPARYRLLVSAMARLLFDRDTVPGAEPEDLLRLEIPALVVPGHDPSHATSAARYLEECLPHAQYWDMPVEEQNEQTAPRRVLEFLTSVRPR